MRAYVRTALLFSMLVSVAGCVDNRGRSNRDGGGEDCPPGTVCLMDSGMHPTDPSLPDSGTGSDCEPEASASACGDFLDNDCDGQIDCNDSSCCGFVTCARGTLCGDMGSSDECGSFIYPEPVPSTCLPRCSAATWNAASSCADSTCFYATLDSDTTPPATPELLRQDGTSTGTTVAIDCSECALLQAHSCMYDSCPSEFVTWVNCDRDVDADGCSGETDILQGCLDVSSTYGPCTDREVLRCFP